MKDAPRSWYLDRTMLDAVNRCMDAIHAAGLSADSAEILPSCLEEAIKASNEVAAKKTIFVAAPVSVALDDGGYDIKPIELMSVQ